MTNSTDERGRLDEQQLARILQKTGPRAVPPEDMRREIRSAVHSTWLIEVDKSKKAKTAANAGWMAIAASVTLVVAAGLFQLQSHSPGPVASVDGFLNEVKIYSQGNWQTLTNKTVNKALTESSRIRTGHDSYLSLTLLDGMNIRVDENTELLLSDVGSVNLDHGRVYIDSYGYRTDNSFVVITEFGSATDIGTQFAVSAKRDGWYVQVREGSVLVEDENIHTTVNIGDGISISANDELTASRVAPGDASWQWAQSVTPKFVLEGKSAAEYLAWVGRETGREVSFRTELARIKAESTIMLGGSTEGLQPGESLGVVLSSTDLEVVDDNSDSILIGMSASN